LAVRVIQGYFVGGQARPLPGVRAAAVVQRRAVAAPVRPGPPAPAVSGGSGAVQAKGGEGSFAVDPVQLGLARSGGNPLPAPLLAKMQAAFDADFSGVRVHVGAQPARIGAIAFTTGNDIYFAPGRYQPDSVQGQQLIGHELAHVVQQRQGRVRATAGGLSVVQDRGLEAEADRLGQRAAMYRAPVQRKLATRDRAVAPQRPGPAHAGRPIQRYTVVGRDKLLYQMPTPRNRPWFGYPYVVIPPNTMFSAQARSGGRAGVDEFLAQGRGDRANIVDRRRNARSLSLRVADDASMAIEDSTLVNRQPKAFFASDDVIADANNALRGNVRLRREGGRLTILTGWYSQQSLSRVVPDFTAAPSQNCNDLAGQIVNRPLFTTRASMRANDSLARLLDEPVRTFDPNANVGSYLHAQDWEADRVERLGMNRWAAPDVGEAYMISTVGPQIASDPVRGTATVRDIRAQEDRVLAWGYHFGAVVAQSGGDRVTLENYARGDNRGGRADPRWYFQMYGTRSGQSFHEFHEARRDYANPVTISTENVPLPVIGPIREPVIF
jgi:hypothetical protein